MPSRRTASANLLLSAAAAAIVAIFLCTGYAGRRAAREIAAARRDLDGKRALRDREVLDSERRLAEVWRNGRRPGAAVDGKVARPTERRPPVASDPEIDRLLLRAHRAGLASEFAALYQALNLSSAQIAEFERLMMAHEAALFDLRAIMRADGLGRSDPEIVAFRLEANSSRNAGLVSALGAAGFSEWQQFERTAGAQGFLARAVNAGYPAEPLSVVQASELTAVLENTSPTYQAGGALELAAVDWDSALSQARGILSPGQLESLEASVAVFELDRLKNRFFAK